MEIKTEVKSAHTPGPWELDWGNTFDKENPPRKGHVVCDVPTAFSSITVRARPDFLACPSVEKLDAIGMANACLIAAAPLLVKSEKKNLEILKGIVGCYDEGEEKDLIEAQIKNTEATLRAAGVAI